MLDCIDLKGGSGSSDALDHVSGLELVGIALDSAVAHPRDMSPFKFDRNDRK